MELPLNSPQVIEKYGTISNQTDYKKSMARSSSALDVLNGITLDAILAPYATSEKDLALQHINNILQLDLQQSLLFLFDRGYPVHVHGCLTKSLRDFLKHPSKLSFLHQSY